MFTITDDAGEVVFTISDAELEKKPNLEDFIKCLRCEEIHEVEYAEHVLGDDKGKLAFYHCGEEEYLVGVAGKDIR